MSNKFTLVLNREITEDENGTLHEEGCPEAVLTTIALPGKDDTSVTQLEFDTEAGPSLAEAIESALEAVKKIPDLMVPTLTVPAQPAAKPDDDGTADGEAKAEALEAEAPEAKAQPEAEAPEETPAEAVASAPEEPQAEASTEPEPSAEAEPEPVGAVAD
jgi:hypothetical protein